MAKSVKTRKATRRVHSTQPTHRFSMEAMFEAQLEKAHRTQDWDFIVDAETCME